MKKIGLKDIAREVGVSTALVSYVLNNKKEDRIGKEVAARIREVAKRLDYQPNQIAKSLKAQKTFTIGLILADISNPFSSQIARIIEDEAKKKGYTVIFGSSDENVEKSKDLINVLLNRQVDGFIIAAVENSEAQLEILTEKGVPFILIDRYFPNKDFSYVAIDNYKASYTAVTHLLENGRKHIGILGYKTSLYHLLERRRGCMDALKSGNLAIDERYFQEVDIHSIEADVKTGINRLLELETPVDALFFTTNTLALFGLKYLVSLNVNIPKDLAIVAFDQTEAYDLFYVPITYVKQPLDVIGKQATAALLEKIDAKDQKFWINLSAELIVQKSSMKK